jgi:hypothetical protein
MEIYRIQDVRRWGEDCEPLLSDSQLAQSDSLSSKYKKVAVTKKFGKGAQTPRNEGILPMEGVRFLVTYG